MVPALRDETYGSAKTPEYNTQGRIVRGYKVQGRKVRDVSSLYFGGGCGGYGREVALGVPVLDFLSTSERRGHQERDCMLASHRRLGSGSCKHLYIYTDTACACGLEAARL
jgi:hypothetical protein